LNEEKTIHKVISDIPQSLVDEIVVVDSLLDNTPLIAEKMGCRVIKEEKKGYGRALKVGIKNVKGNIIVYMDGDYTYDPKEISLLISPIINEKFDVVLGCRINGNLKPGSMSKINKVGNRLITSLFNILFSINLCDSQTGFRAFRRDRIKDIICKEDGMTFVTEQLIKLVKSGFRIKEVPVTYRIRDGKSKLNPLVDGLRITLTLIKERISSY